MTASATSKNWRDGLTAEEKAIVFEELFMHELESWFTADIACCDNCHDDFVAEWPYAYSADGARFQCDSIDLHCFYSGSRLADSYTEEEFQKLLPSSKTWTAWKKPSART